jgi:hypothetical protein
MRVKRLMKKNSTKRGMAVGWFASAITKGDLNKAKKAGFLPESMEYAFLGDEFIPRQEEGFRVMFLSFLLRGFLSLPTNFFVGFFSFTACSCISSRPIPPSMLRAFITLCEAFLGIDPHWGLWKRILYLRCNASKEEIHDVGGAIVGVRSDAQY